jgi:hypothetical protein
MANLKSYLTNHPCGVNSEEFLRELEFGVGGFLEIDPILDFFFLICFSHSL